MRKQYVSKVQKPTAWIMDEDLFFCNPQSITIFEEDVGPEDTGLLDEYGNPIVAVYNREPIGFVIHDDYDE